MAKASGSRPPLGLGSILSEWARPARPTQLHQGVPALLPKVPQVCDGVANGCNCPITNSQQKSSYGSQPNTPQHPHRSPRLLDQTQAARRHVPGCAAGCSWHAAPPRASCCLCLRHPAWFEGSARPGPSASPHPRHPLRFPRFAGWLAWSGAVEPPGRVWGRRVESLPLKRDIKRPKRGIK